MNLWDGFYFIAMANETTGLDAKVYRNAEKY